MQSTALSLIKWSKNWPRSRTPDVLLGYNYAGHRLMVPFDNKLVLFNPINKPIKKNNMIGSDRYNIYMNNPFPKLLLLIYKILIFISPWQTSLEIIPSIVIRPQHLTFNTAHTKWDRLSVGLGNSELFNCLHMTKYQKSYKTGGD